MATENECKFYKDCGFVQWRAKHVDSNSTPLPEDGDCGKIVYECGRLDGDVPIHVTAKGPQTRQELEIAYPKIPNKNGRPERRLQGGAHR
ncbi:MAG: hypothetical protein ABSE04_00725 [Candidatus Microgenomates bacterium]|jgi:hypothetical protein